MYSRISSKCTYNSDINNFSELYKGFKAVKRIIHVMYIIHVRFQQINGVSQRQDKELFNVAFTEKYISRNIQRQVQLKEISAWRTKKLITQSAYLENSIQKFGFPSAVYLHPENQSQISIQSRDIED